MYLKILYINYGVTTIVFILFVNDFKKICISVYTQKIYCCQHLFKR